jgi:acyl-CoA synthetase (AMP-forming)/AMP-acid ligase II
MSHLLAAGAGCESFNNGQVRRIQKFLNDHGCKAVFSMGFGLSEAGSSLMFPNPMYPATDGSVGMPMPLNNIGIFKGEKEVGYNQVGEVCVNTPGMMLGYDSEEATKKIIRTHADGRVWLHTSDSGYMNEDGVLYLLGRGYYKRFCGAGQEHKRLVEIVMENLISDAQIKGLVDAFFVFRPDKDHEGFYVPYLFAVLEDGYTVDDIRESVDAALERHQRPAAIIQIPERPFFHFKTDRLHMEVPSIN